jgi:hypothetical protein
VKYISLNYLHKSRNYTQKVVEITSTSLEKLVCGTFNNTVLLKINKTTELPSVQGQASDKSDMKPLT